MRGIVEGPPMEGIPMIGVVTGGVVDVPPTVPPMKGVGFMPAMGLVGASESGDGVLCRRRVESSDKARDLRRVVSSDPCCGGSPLRRRECLGEAMVINDVKSL